MTNPMEIEECPICHGPIVMIEYSHDHPKHYDGVSEIACLTTMKEGKPHWVIGRWCGQELHEGESESRFCERKPHA